MIVADDRYEVEQDPYCYSGTDVLKNKQGLRDEYLLRDFELEMTSLRSREALPTGALDSRSLPRHPPPSVSGRLHLGGEVPHGAHVARRQCLLLC